MGRQRVPLFGNITKCVQIDPDATEGAVVGENLWKRNADGSLSVFDFTADVTVDSASGTATLVAQGGGSNSGYPQASNPAAAPTNFDLDASMIAGLNNPQFPTLNYILVGDGALWIAVPMSGDATILASGAISVNKLHTARTIAASGDATWSVSFDGSANVTAALAIGANKVTFAQQAQIAAHTIPSNITGSTADQVANSLSAILDAEIGSTRGMIIRRGSSAWQALSLGTTGQAVVSDGTDALWGTVGGGSGGGLTFVGKATVTGAAASIVTLSGLSLSSGVGYLLMATLQNATVSNSNISIYYNGDTSATNYDECRMLVTASVAGARANDSFIFGLNGSGTSVVQMWIRSDLNGNPSALSWAREQATTSIQARFSTQMWRTSAPVTSISLSSSVANALAVGTSFSLYSLSV